MSEWRFLLVAAILLLQCNFLWTQTGTTYTPEELHRHFQNEAESYEIFAKGATKPFELKPKPLMHWQVDLARNDASVWTAPLKIELQSAVFNQTPNAPEPYFSFKPPVAIPAPEQLR